MGLGGAQLVTLAEARDKATEYRKKARDGGDPLAEKRKASRSVPTFEAATQTVFSEHAPGWRNARHSEQWLNSLRAYAFPLIGRRRVDQIDTPEVLKVLAPIWLTKPETAKRVRQRIRTVLDWAKAAGHRSGENPADSVRNGLPKQAERTGHHAALPYSEIPSFIRRLQESDVAEMARLAFEFLILTATRTSEALGARCSEINLEQKVWTIPPERMKGRREHRIPLSPRAIEIVQRALDLSPNCEFIFASTRLGRPLGPLVFFKTLRTLGNRVTAHGFRASFRDWAGERTNFPREVCEAALAHVVKDKAERAYARSDLFEKRRKLMDTWAGFVSATPGKVVPIQAKAGRR